MANIRDNGEQRLLLEEDADNKPGYNGDAPSEQQEALAAPNHSNDDDERHVFQFYIFICLSTAFKSFEAGIISSMMADIQKDFDLGYDQEGTVTASPDYGIAPGALLAIWVFRWFSAYGILTTVLWGTAIVSIICAIHPTLPTLLIARAVGGFLWSHAATHFPVWIDRHGPPAQKTIWLAFTNVSLMIGVLSGYIMGGLIRAMDVNLTWVNLYFIEGVLMAVCGAIFALFFEPELLRIDQNKKTAPKSTRQQDEPNNGTKSTSEEDLGTVILLLMKSPPFYLAVALTGCISGGIVYSLYFATQVCEARGMTVTTTVQLISTVFITAPAPGIIFGSWIVNKLGGYTDHVVTFGVSLGSAIIVLMAASAMPISWAIWRDTWQLPYFLAFWVFSFVGAMSGPPLNGVAVSAVPRASHVASAVQFALANAAKIVVPQIGGYVCSVIGLIDGFNVTLVSTAALFVILSWAGLMHAIQERRQERNAAVSLVV